MLVKMHTRPVSVAKFFPSFLSYAGLESAIKSWNRPQLSSLVTGDFYFYLPT